MHRVRTAVCTLLLALLAGCGQPDKPSVTLYLALQRGDLDQLERHIHWETDINAELPDGRYPLHIAAEKGKFSMVDTLLKHGADIDSRTAGGDTPLDLSILAGRTQIAEILLASGAKLDASALLIKGAMAGITDRDSVRFLNEHGADLEHRNAAGDTALLIAIRQNNHRLASHLVNLGANVDAKTQGGVSALALAREQQATELVRLLKRLGAR